MPPLNGVAAALSLVGRSGRSSAALDALAESRRLGSRAWGADRGTPCACAEMGLPLETGVGPARRAPWSSMQAPSWQWNAVTAKWSLGYVPPSVEALNCAPMAPLWLRCGMTPPGGKLRCLGYFGRLTSGPWTALGQRGGGSFGEGGRGDAVDATVVAIAHAGTGSLPATRTTFAPSLPGPGTPSWYCPADWFASAGQGERRRRALG